MSIDNKQLLRMQLEQQARLFTENENDVDLIYSVLSTCSALLKAVESNIPKFISQADFDSIFAGYYGIANKVNKFYSNNSSYFNPDESSIMQGLLNSSKQAEDSKKKYDKQYEDAKKIFQDAESKLSIAKQAYEDEESKYQSLAKDVAEINKKLRSRKSTMEQMNTELKNTTEKIENFEVDIEKLINEFNSAKSSYEDLAAYYVELERVQKSIKEDGYIDMESFYDKIHSMNDSGEKLIEEYDSLFKKITSDIETLQAKIEKRRKP